MLIQVTLQVLLSTVFLTGSLATSLISDVDRGNACLDRGAREEAKECFKDALKANPKDTAAYLGLARTESNSPEAIEYCTKALAINPNLADAYSIRANAYAFQKQYQLAIDDYTKVIKLQPSKLLHETIANQYVLRGDTFESFGQRDKAIADF